MAPGNWCQRVDYLTMSTLYITRKKDMQQETKEIPVLRLLPKEDRRLSQGHVWVYSNEVDTAVTPLQGFTAGQVAHLYSHSEKFLGLVMLNPQALICARLISRHPEARWGQALIKTHLEKALHLRERFYSRPYYRLCYGDSDALPGLVIDRFAGVLVLQISTVGMEQVRSWIVQALVELLQPEGILLKNDALSRAQEGLPSYVEVAYGTVPPTLMVEVSGGVCLSLDAFAGQKTGWFYDHTSSRQWLAPLTRNRRVLDVFSYVGAWSLQAAVEGASNVVAVDSSAPALALLRDNAVRLGVQERVQTLEGDAFALLAQLREERQGFDVVILDPPALIKRRKDHRNGLTAYRRLNELAMRLLPPQGGLLMSCSCSMHLETNELLDILRASARHLDRNIQLMYQGHQGPDHPVLPAVPETAYLRALAVWVDKTV